MDKISIKTGTYRNAQTGCKAVLQVCDMDNNCCETTSKGQGLDDLSKDDRESGQIDDYTGTKLLNTCAQVG